MRTPFAAAHESLRGTFATCRLLPGMSLDQGYTGCERLTIETGAFDHCDISEPNNSVVQFGTARPRAARSIRPIFSEGARLEICRDYDIIFLVVVCHPVANRRLVLCRLLHECRVGGCRVARGADPLLYPYLTLR